MLSRPVSGQSLAVVRIGLGLAIAYILGSFVIPRGEQPTLLESLVTGPQNVCHVPYPGLEWLRPLPQPWMTVAMWAGVVASVLFAAGCFYRLVASVMFFTTTYLWLVDQSLYGNHFALASTLSLLMCFLPSDRCWRLTRIQLSKTASDSRPDGKVRFWAVWLLRAEVWLIYFFGGLAKLHPDWLSGEPIRLWYREGLVVGRIAEIAGPEIARNVQPMLENEAVIYLIALGGVAFDLSIGTLLLIRRTRLFGIVGLLIFHTHNLFLIDRVGVVAPMSAIAATIFFDPNWPARAIAWLKRPHFSPPDLRWFTFGFVLLPPLGAALGWKLGKNQERGNNDFASPPIGMACLVGIFLWLSIQIALPLRHYGIQGDAYWTDEGVRLSWFLLTRNKVGDFARFEVRDLDILVDNGSGRRDVAWDRWQVDRPDVLFHELTATDVPWRVMPRFFACYEPLLGLRVFAHLPEQEALDEGGVKATLLSQWQERGGGRARFERCRPLNAVLAEIHQRIAEHSDQSPVYAWELAQIEDAQNRLIRLQQSETAPSHRLRQFRGLVNHLEPLILVGPSRRRIAAALHQVRPFDLQGNRVSPGEIYRVVDPTMTSRDDNARLDFDAQRWSDSPYVYIDLSCLMARHFDPLPTWIITYATDAPPRIFANHARELNQSQLRDLARTPMVAYAYARFLADRWEADFGRRPAVFASAHAQLNHHPLQPILDETTNLAAARYLWLQHNRWILPLKRAAAGTTTY